MLVSTTLAFSLAMQAQPATADTQQLDRPTYWVTEYPLIIQPLVQDYRRCLNYADRRFAGEADFETQHKADLPRCEKLKLKLVAKSEEALRQGRWSEVLEPEDAKYVFQTVGEVHVGRGRAFDNQLMSMYRVQQARQRAAEPAPQDIEVHEMDTYEDTVPQGQLDTNQGTPVNVKG